MPGRLYYGWVVVAASFVILTTAYGLQFSYGIFLPHILRDLELDRAAASAPFSVYVVVYCLLSLISGHATDRVGPRIVCLTGGGFIATGYFLLSSATGEWQIYIYLSLIAGIGMSTSFVPLNATVVKWFIRRRGLALALAGSGTTAALVIGPMAAALLIPGFGWRGAMALLGLAGGAVIAVAALLLVRDPESRKVRVDGAAAERPADAVPAAAGEPSWTLGEARATSSFWCILGIFFLTWVMLFLPYIHLPILLADLGHGPASAAGLIAAIGVGGFAGRLSMGWMSDRIGRSPGLFAGLGLQVLAGVIFALADSLAFLALASALFGFGAGATATLLSALVGDIFGRKHAGALIGFIVSIAGSASAIGPYAGGLIKDMTGSYQGAFLIGAGLNAASIVLVVLLRPPQKPQ